MPVVYKSNGARVGDGLRVTRVSLGGEKFEILIDPKTERYSEVAIAAPDPITWEIEMPTYLEKDGDVLIPVGRGHIIYDMVVGGTTYTVDIANPVAFSFSSGIWSISISPTGDVTVSQQAGTETGNPSSGTTTILTVTSWRTCTADGLQISNSKATFAVKVIAVAPGDVTAPVLTGMTPGDVGVPITTNIVLTFDEDIVKNTGNLYVRNVSTNSVIETINVATAPTSGAGSIAYSGQSATINPTSDLPNNTVIGVRYDAGVFKDAAGNGVAQLGDDSRVFTTVAANPSLPATVDVTVSTKAQVRSTLLAWSANWNGTVPAGKTAADQRVVGFDQTITDGIDLSGISGLAQRCYVRPVGTFTGNATTGTAACSVYISAPSSTAPLITMAGSTNIVLYLCDIRATSVDAGPNDFLTEVGGSTKCGFIRCLLSGSPINFDGLELGKTRSAVFTSSGTVDLILKNNVYQWFDDGLANFDGTNTRTIIDMNLGYHGGGSVQGNDFTVYHTTGRMDDTYLSGYATRHKLSGSGNHQDFFQTFMYPADTTRSAILNRIHVKYVIHLRGQQPAGSTWNYQQSVFINQNNASSVGPHLVEQCLWFNGHQWALDGIGGTGTKESRYCTAGPLHVDPSHYSPPYVFSTTRSHFPTIKLLGTVTGHLVFPPDDTSNAWLGIQGTNGVRVPVGATPNFNLMTQYMENYPTETSTLWDVRPKAGTRAHPDYTPAGDRVGCWEYWQKMFAADAEVCLSEVGWPCAPFFIKEYDPANNFGSSYTGTYDGNGNNI